KQVERPGFWSPSWDDDDDEPAPPPRPKPAARPPVRPAPRSGPRSGPEPTRRVPTGAASPTMRVPAAAAAAMSNADRPTDYLPPVQGEHRSEPQLLTHREPDDEGYVGDDEYDKEGLTEEEER